MFKSVFSISFLLIIILTFSACDKEEIQLKKDDQKILDYLEENSIDANKHESGLYYTIEKTGAGGHPDISSEVEVKYKGYLLDGSLFDETVGSSTIKFPLSGLIEGWQIGIPLLQEGGKGIFYLPSKLGYGINTVGTIPANSVLIFDIELVSFK